NKQCPGPPRKGNAVVNLDGTDGQLRNGQPAPANRLTKVLMCTSSRPLSVVLRTDWLSMCRSCPKERPLVADQKGRTREPVAALLRGVFARGYKVSEKSSRFVFPALCGAAKKTGSRKLNGLIAVRPSQPICGRRIRRWRGRRGPNRSSEADRGFRLG